MRTFTTSFDTAMRGKETPLLSFIESYLLWNNRLSEKSRREYERYLRGFDTFCGGPTLGAFSAELASGWVRYLRARSPYVARYGCAVLKSFASFLAEENHLSSGGSSVLAHIKMPRSPGTVREPMSDDELRLSDVHLDLDGRSYIVVQWQTSKGMRNRRIRLDAQAIGPIHEYIVDARPPWSGSGPEVLFLTAGGKPFSSQGFQNWCARLGDDFEAAGVRDWKLHRMRHTWATWYHRARHLTGNTFRDMKMEGGWLDDQTPERYVKDRPWDEMAEMPTPISALLGRRRRAS